MSNTVNENLSVRCLCAEKLFILLWTEVGWVNGRFFKQKIGLNALFLFSDTCNPESDSVNMKQGPVKGGHLERGVHLKF